MTKRHVRPNSDAKIMVPWGPSSMGAYLEGGVFASERRVTERAVSHHDPLGGFTPSPGMLPYLGPHGALIAVVPSGHPFLGLMGKWPFFMFSGELRPTT